MPTKCISRIFQFRDTRSGQFLTSPIISLRGKHVSAHNAWTGWHRRVKAASMCLSHRSEFYDMQYDPVWPDLDLRSNFQIDLSGSKWVLFELSWREKHKDAKIIALDPTDQKLWTKNENWKKIVCLNSVNIDLWRSNRWPKVKSDGMLAIDNFIVHLFFFADRFYLL